MTTTLSSKLKSERIISDYSRGDIREESARKKLKEQGWTDSSIDELFASAQSNLILDKRGRM